MKGVDLRISKDIFKNLFSKIIIETGLNQSEIIKMMNWSTSTAKGILTKADSKLNAEIAISFCNEFGFNVNDIYYPKEKNLKDNNRNAYIKALDSYTEKLMSERGDRCSSPALEFTDTVKAVSSSCCHELNDESYFGTFYGYCYNSQYNGHLDSFVLKIFKDENNKTRAELDLTCYSTIGFDKETTRTKHLEGVPLHLEKDLIYIVFNQSDGNELYVFAYNHIALNSGMKIFCRHGALLSTCRGSHVSPQIQSFVFTDGVIAKKNLHYIKSLLKLAQDNVFVPENDFNELAKNNEYVKECIEKDILIHKRLNMCWFSENTIFNRGVDEGINPKVLIEALSAIKEFSANPRFVTFPDFQSKSKLYAKLIKDIQEDPTK